MRFNLIFLVICYSQNSDFLRKCCIYTQFGGIMTNIVNCMTWSDLKHIYKSVAQVSQKGNF